MEKELNGFLKDILEQVSIHEKYDIYPEKQKELVEKMIQLEDFMIPETFDYQKISALGIEARQRTYEDQTTLGLASRISGINPSDV